MRSSYLYLAALLVSGVTPGRGDGSCSGGSSNPNLNHDQKGGKILAGIKPHYIKAISASKCCRACAAYDGCDTYVWQPSTTYCWFVRGSEKIVERADRVVGFTTSPPPSPTPPPPPPPTPAVAARVTITQWNSDTFRIIADLPGLPRPKGTPPGALVANTLPNPTSISSSGGGGGGGSQSQTISNGNLEAILYPNSTAEKSF